MKKTIKIDRRKIALVHVAKRQVGMTDDEYRALLGQYGAASSKDLTVARFKLVMKRFEHLGFKSRSFKRRAPAVDSRGRLLKKIEAQLAALGLTAGYADAIARNIFKGKYPNLGTYRWLKDPVELRKVVAALTYYQRRQAKKVKSE